VFDEESEEAGLSKRMVAHNLALLDALAEASEAKKRMAEEMGNVIKAILIKFGGEITLDGTFIAAAESPTCTLNHEILSNGEALRFWVEEVEEGDDE
jgi:hypothetical protein